MEFELTIPSSDIREGVDEFAGFIFLWISSINALELDLNPCR
jgi:hypothetical protein